MQTVTIAPLDGPPDTTVTVPGSKSLTNRALVCAALADGVSVLDGALFSDDTRYMADALRAVGVGVAAEADVARMTVGGVGGRVPAADADVFVGNAGTAARFLPPLLALGRGRYRIDGVARMRERPVAPLLAALAAIGADVRARSGDDRFPLVVHGGTVRGGAVEVAADLSSQHVSGLLLAAPYFDDGLDLTIDGPAVSAPYLEMTVSTMAAFGVTVDRPSPQRFVVAPGGYRATTFAVEPDASAASYFFAAAALTGGRVTVRGLGTGSVQGDLRLAEILGDMGCSVTVDATSTTVRGPSGGTGLRGVDVDMADCSDVAQTLAVVAACAEGPTRVRGIGFVRGKETDRVGAVVTELRRLGAVADEHDDGYTVHPFVSGRPLPEVVRTYDDHRMAMSFAVLGLRFGDVTVADPDCTAKTFPGYWEALDALR
jgi:3-phosphoshikimate 1-carboxyvinyltransferase